MNNPADKREPEQPSAWSAYKCTCEPGKARCEYCLLFPETPKPSTGACEHNWIRKQLDPTGAQCLKCGAEKDVPEHPGVAPLMAPNPCEICGGEMIVCPCANRDCKKPFVCSNGLFMKCKPMAPNTAEIRRYAVGSSDGEYYESENLNGKWIKWADHLAVMKAKDEFIDALSKARIYEHNSLREHQETIKALESQLHDRDLEIQKLKSNKGE